MNPSNFLPVNLLTIASRIVTGSPSRPLWRWLPHLSLALFAALAAGGCKPQGESQPLSAPPPPVTVATPIRKEVVEWDEYTGRRNCDKPDAEKAVTCCGQTFAAVSPPSSGNFTSS